MKKGSDGRKCLHYLDRAVELNDYDEAALVARSRSAVFVHYAIVERRRVFYYTAKL